MKLENFEGGGLVVLCEDCELSWEAVQSLIMRGGVGDDCE
jgi:hypothetical protein